MEATQEHIPVGRKSHRIILIGIPVLLLGLIATAILADHFWPFTEKAVRASLSEAAAAEVSFGTFHAKYFPPGCVAENVVLTRENHAQIIEIRRLTISSGLSALIRGHVGLFRGEDMRVTVAVKDFGRNQVRKQTIIDKFIADGAVLEIKRGDSRQPLRFTFQKFLLENLNGPGTSKFSAVFENPLPHGTISTAGQFGPWNSSDPASTAMTGKYSLENADLGVFHSIGGTVSALGNFSGNFKQLAVQGATHTPNFVVAKTGHGVPLETNFSAFVNAVNGDVTLRQVKAQFGRDQIGASGSIARREDGRRSALVDLRCDGGRIEDTFYPFIGSPKSPLAGEVSFQMHVNLPSRSAPFLQKLQLKSSFRIRNAHFTNPQTEQRVSKVSSPPKEDQSKTLANFQGSVKLESGVAHFSQLSVHDDDAAALLSGTFNLDDQKVNLHGKLRTQASLAKTTHGIKAVFAKAIEPFFKKRPHETIVPVHVGGTYSKPSFGLDLGS